MKILLAADFISLNINLPLSKVFSFEDSEITCTDCFLYEVNCRSYIITLALKILSFLHNLSFSDVFLRILLYLLLRCKNYGLSDECARSSRNWFTRGCVWLLILFPSIVNYFPSHFELLHVFVLWDAIGLEGDNLVPFCFVAHNLPNTWIKWMKI